MKRPWLVLLVVLATPVVVSWAQFGAYERPQINATSNFWAKHSITLGGVERTSWPAGGSGSGETDHAELSNLAWAASGHTGTPARIAGFLEGGTAGYIPVGLGLYLDGSDQLTISNEIIAAVDTVAALVTTTSVNTATSLANAAAISVLQTGSLDRAGTLPMMGDLNMGSNDILRANSIELLSTTNLPVVIKALNSGHLTLISDLFMVAPTVWDTENLSRAEQLGGLMASLTNGAVTSGAFTNGLLFGAVPATVAQVIGATGTLWSAVHVLSNRQYDSGWTFVSLTTNAGAEVEEIWVLNSRWGDLNGGWEMDIITNVAGGWLMGVYDWRTNVSNFSYVSTPTTPTAQHWRDYARLLPQLPPRPRSALLGSNYPFDGSNMTRTAAGTYTNCTIVVDGYGNITNIASAAEPSGVGVSITNGVITAATNATANAGQVLRNGTDGTIGIGTNTTEGVITLTNSADTVGVVVGSGATWGVGTNTSGITGTPSDLTIASTSGVTATSWTSPAIPAGYARLEGSYHTSGATNAATILLLLLNGDSAAAYQQIRIVMTDSSAIVSTNWNQTGALLGVVRTNLAASVSAGEWSIDGYANNGSPKVVRVLDAERTGVTIPGANAIFERYVSTYWPSNQAVSTVTIVGPLSNATIRVKVVDKFQ